MPTRKQLHRRWKRDMELGIDINTGRSYTPIKEPEEFTGNVVGEIEYDPDKKEMRIIPNSEIGSDNPDVK